MHDICYTTQSPAAGLSVRQAGGRSLKHGKRVSLDSHCARTHQGSVWEDAVARGAAACVGKGAGGRWKDCRLWFAAQHARNRARRMQRATAARASRAARLLQDAVVPLGRLELGRALRPVCGSCAEGGDVRAKGAGALLAGKPGGVITSA